MVHNECEYDEDEDLFIEDEMEDEEMNTQQLAPEKTHLLDRTRALSWEHIRKLEKHFHLSDDPQPENYEEMRKRLESGKFTLPKDDASYNGFYGYAPNIAVLRWRDPEHPADKKGYKNALDTMVKLQIKTEDEIIVKNPEEGLKALETFENATFH